MHKVLIELRRHRIARYVAVGGGVYLLELAVILTSQSLGASPVLAVGISFWVGLVISFLLQKLITFEDKRTDHKILLPQIVVYCLLVLFNFGFTIAATKLISPPVPAVIARTGALAITTIWNFYIYRTKIFNKTDKLVY